MIMFDVEFWLPATLSVIRFIGSAFHIRWKVVGSASSWFLDKNVNYIHIYVEELNYDMSTIRFASSTHDVPQMIVDPNLD